MPIPGAGFEGVWINIAFLRAVRLGDKVAVGNRVVVLGGGNVAFDCGRVARRLGAGEVHIACLESREKMTADPQEITQGQEEGIRIHPSKTFLEITGENGCVTGVRCQDVSSFSFDETGKAIIDVVVGSEHILPADTVIFAVGQRPEQADTFDLPAGRGNRITVDPVTLGTGKDAIFAAGDIVTGTISVIAAIAAGKKAAVGIDQFLGGNGIIDEQLAPGDEPSPHIGREEGFAQRRRCENAAAEPGRRITNFDALDACIDEEMALRESQRCLQCDLRTRITEKKFWGDFPS